MFKSIVLAVSVGNETMVSDGEPVELHHHRNAELLINTTYPGKIEIGISTDTPDCECVASSARPAPPRRGKRREGILY